MQQFGACAFYTVVRKHKSGEVDSKCISHNDNSIVLAICLSTNYRKQVGHFWTTLYI